MIADPKNPLLAGFRPDLTCEEITLALSRYGVVECQGTFWTLVPNDIDAFCAATDFTRMELKFGTFTIVAHQLNRVAGILDSIWAEKSITIDGANATRMNQPLYKVCMAATPSSDEDETSEYSPCIRVEGGEDVLHIEWDPVNCRFCIYLDGEGDQQLYLQKTGYHWDVYSRGESTIRLNSR